MHKASTTTDEGFVAILVGVQRQGEDVQRSMEELEALVEAAGGHCAAVVVQSLEHIHPATHIGKGKVEEIAALCVEEVADTVVFDDELSGAKLRNLEDAFGVRVIDRSILILDIFAGRARSKEGKLQVELAQLSYRLPRLMGFGRSLSRLGGGIGTRGPGEKKLETDRRHIEARIDDIKAELKKAERTGETKRKKRRRSGLPLVALVGYTNAGKSSLMNRLLAEEGREEKEVYAENMLFATLDAEQRRLRLPGGRECILSDTVGFVSKLPHSLVKAFRGTLEEALGADLLLHVVDASYEDREFQMDVTASVLKEIGAEAIPCLMVYNKADRLAPGEDFLPSRPGVLLSAKYGDGVEELRQAMEEQLFPDLMEVELRIPYTKGALLSYLCERGQVREMVHEETGTRMRVELSKEEWGKVKDYAVL